MFMGRSEDVKKRGLCLKCLFFCKLDQVGGQNMEKTVKILLLKIFMLNVHQHKLKRHIESIGLTIGILPVIKVRAVSCLILY